MTRKAPYREIGHLDLPELEKEVLAFWKTADVFKRSVAARPESKPFVFYEGPPSANGLPGIHHVMSRSIKDTFCRYHTMLGYRVERKGGWDTHGLPVELGVEKMLGITKEDIGKTITVEEYNRKCREEVMRFKDVWDKLTDQMGMWVDLEDPYITFDRNYVESLWALLRKLYDRDLLYKGYTIQPYSPAAGTGLSSHELNLPGCYRNIKDTSAIAMFKRSGTEEFLLAWTTTPWTLPSNTALAVGADITYVRIATRNRYTLEPMVVWLAESRLDAYFTESKGYTSGDPDSWKEGDKLIPFRQTGQAKGAELAGSRYEQLLPYVQPEEGDAFKIICGDFVTTSDGTGIVHIAPSFGADDLKVARENGIGALTLVDRQGRFVPEVTDFAGRYVKNYTDEQDYQSVDIDISVLLKKRGQAFLVEKYEHNYPHCWRTDKPIIYYPLESWFLKTTAFKDRLIELNKTIRWQPEFTGTGRFGNWLENLVDWNLSRSRFWGTPLPIWRTEDGTEFRCIGSFEELKDESRKAVEAGFMEAELDDQFDPHRPFVDDVILVSEKGFPMRRETDLIDVWFDSGAMPYAQWHYPLKGAEKFAKSFPADFIAEGVDQTRGWFFTLHALAVMLEDSVAFKNVVSNGLVLDKDGNKMSKRLGNAVDPFMVMDAHGADATRWYLLTNAQPWENLRFDEAGIEEVRRRFFGTLHNSYAFFALYANIDQFTNDQPPVPLARREELDRWILSKLNSLIADVRSSMNDYDPTKAGRAIQEFLSDHLSNWYVRLSRKRFWKGEMGENKLAAYQTLHTCLEVITRLMAPIAPFYADVLYRSLQAIDQKDSVHLADFPASDSNVIDAALEQRMDWAQRMSSLALSLRKKAGVKVRQPLRKLLVPALDAQFEADVAAIADLVKTEVNIKQIEFMKRDEGLFTRSVKPDFRKLGPRYGARMKEVASMVTSLSEEQIASYEANGRLELESANGSIIFEQDDLMVSRVDIPGWEVASDGPLTVALDVTIDETLRAEGIARELVNRVQRLRKDEGFEVTDRIRLRLHLAETHRDAITSHKNYICRETLAEDFSVEDTLASGTTFDVEGAEIKIALELF